MTLISSDVFACSPGGEWRIKYNRAIREMDFTKKKLQQEFEDKLETEQQSKRHLDRKARTSEHEITEIITATALLAQNQR